MDTRQADILELVRLNARLINAIVTRYGRPTNQPDGDDFRSVAFIAVAHAYDTFDPSHGSKFSTYLFYLVRREVQNEARRMRGAVKTVPLSEFHDERFAKRRRIPTTHEPDPALHAVVYRVAGEEGDLLRHILSDGLSTEDAGELLGKTPGQSRAMYARAIHRARTLVAEDAMDGDSV